MRSGRALSLIVFAVACNSGSSGPAGAAGTSSAATPAPSVSVGMEIVAATSKVAFRQGKIVKIDGDKVTFEYGRPDPTTQARPTTAVPAAQVWPLGTPSSAAAGARVICRVARRTAEIEPLPTWYPCKVLALASGKLRVVDQFGTEYELDPEHVIEPDQATAEAIGEYIATEERHRSFDGAFEAAGRPARPSGWKPKVGDQAVIHFVGTSWYGGTIIALVGDDKVRIDWEGERWDDREVGLAEVVPRPTAPAEVKVDQFVILRPKAAQERWDHYKVVNVQGDKLELVDRNDNKRSADKNDVVPIVPAS